MRDIAGGRASLLALLAGLGAAGVGLGRRLRRLLAGSFGQSKAALAGLFGVLAGLGDRGVRVGDRTRCGVNWWLDHGRWHVERRRVVGRGAGGGVSSGVGSPRTMFPPVFSTWPGATAAASPVLMTGAGPSSAPAGADVTASAARILANTTPVDMRAWYRQCDDRAMADRPWIMRTYSGHSTARASNELYRTNLAKGQTGLSVAFDLPTQTGYDPDAPQAAGEVGKVGVPVAHLGHVEQLFEGIPVDEITTSMTINAPASWLLALYIANAENRGIDSSKLTGTTQNDIVKEYLSRGTHIFPPVPSRRLTVDTIAYTVRHVPQWNPINVCSYHLQEAGATPVQELAFTMATAVGILDAARESGQVTPDELPAVVGRISFFVNAGIRFVEETCKMRAFNVMWDRICAERYAVTDPKLRRFRYAVQVNSLGLTEAQPENNVQRIILEMLGVTLSRDARARSIQLPAWNEALGLPRPWDQQWALRMQQVLAFETDLLEYDDIFVGSHVIEARTAELVEEATAELEDVLALGGAFEAIDELKARLVRSQADRRRRIETGELPVVGVNSFTETEPSPLGGEGAILKVDPAVEAHLRDDLAAWKAKRDNGAVTSALDELRRVAADRRERHARHDRVGPCRRHDR